MGEVTARAADLPDAFVGLLPCGFQEIQKRSFNLPAGLLELHSHVPGLIEKISHLTVDVQLELMVGGVADPHWLRLLVAGEPIDLFFRKPPLTSDTVHDAGLCRLAGDSAQQPLAPRSRLFQIAGVQEGEEGEGRVAQPANTIIPVANAADPFRKRSGGRGDDTAGGSVSKRLQCDERTQYLLAPLALVGA